MRLALKVPKKLIASNKLFIHVGEKALVILWVRLLSKVIDEACEAHELLEIGISHEALVFNEVLDLIVVVIV